jgi:hypothetical protein
MNTADTAALIANMTDPVQSCEWDIVVAGQAAWNAAAVESKPKELRITCIITEKNLPAHLEGKPVTVRAYTKVGADVASYLDLVYELEDLKAVLFKLDSYPTFGIHPVMEMTFVYAYSKPVQITQKHSQK